MAVLLAPRAGHLVARLVEGGKWTVFANTNRHLVSLDTDKERQRACPGDGWDIDHTSLVSLCCKKKGDGHSLCASGFRILDGQRCHCLR